jgi:hypothetical protein
VSCFKGFTGQSPAGSKYLSLEPASCSRNAILDASEKCVRKLRKYVGRRCSHRNGITCAYGFHLPAPRAFFEALNHEYDRLQRGRKPDPRHTRSRRDQRFADRRRRNLGTGCARWRDRASRTGGEQSGNHQPAAPTNKLTPKRAGDQTRTTSRRSPESRPSRSLSRSSPARRAVARRARRPLPDSRTCNCWR